MRNLLKLWTLIPIKTKKDFKISLPLRTQLFLQEPFLLKVTDELAKLKCQVKQRSAAQDSIQALPKLHQKKPIYENNIWLWNKQQIDQSRYSIRYLMKQTLCKKNCLKILQSTPSNRTPLPSDTNCQGTEFLPCNVLCFNSLIGQPRYPTMTTKL